MEIKFDVKMTTSIMYDYMMYVTLTGWQFWMTIVIGILLTASFVVNHNFFYLLGAVAIVVYLPIERYAQARKQVKLNPVFKEVLHYTITEDKMSIDVLEEHMDAELSSLYRVTSTKNSLLLFTNRITATIFPKEALGSDYDKVVKILKDKVPGEKVKIK